MLWGIVAECFARQRDVERARYLFEWTVKESERLAWDEGIANSLVSLALLDRVAGSFEVYHPKRRGAFQVSREIHSKGWREEPLPGRPPLRCAAPDADSRALAQQVVTTLGGQALWRAALQPEKPNLILSLPLPASETRTPLPVFTCLPQLAKIVAARRASS